MEWKWPLWATIVYSLVPSLRTRGYCMHVWCCCDLLNQKFYSTFIFARGELKVYPRTYWSEQLYNYVVKGKSEMDRQTEKGRERARERERERERETGTERSGLHNNLRDKDNLSTTDNVAVPVVVVRRFHCKPNTHSYTLHCLLMPVVARVILQCSYIAIIATIKSYHYTNSSEDFISCVEVWGFL